MKIGLQTWGSEGDIQPFIALAAGLARAGHEATLVVSDNAARDYSAHAERFGFHIRHLSNPDMPTTAEAERILRDIIRAGNPIRQVKLVMRHVFDPVAQSMHQAATELCRTNDAVIGHFFVFPLHVAAEKAGIPLAKVSIVHNCQPSAEICPPGLPDLGRWFYPLGWRLVRGMVNKIFLPRINALRKREGLRLDHDVMLQSWASDTLNLIAVSPSICRAPADWEGRHSVCGFLNLPREATVEQAPAELVEFLETGEPPVYFTFGSMMLADRDYIREVVGIWSETVRRVGCRAVFQLPWENLSDFATGEHVVKVKRSPYKTVFPKCALVVHHGGAGTTQSCLLAGRPSVVVAHMADQFFWGAELERLGVAGATRHRKGLAATGLARSIAQVLAAPHMAAKAATLGAAMSAEDGVKAAVALVEARLAFPRSDARLQP